MKIPFFQKNQPCFSSWKGAVLGGLLATGLLVTCSVHAEVSEPETVFYGKIVNRTSGQEYVLTHGTLSWVISRPDGSRLTLNGSLEPLNNGAYSYRLKVPHEALAYGLSVSASAVPLGAKPAACSHVQIMVDGSSASIMAPGSSTFGVAQNLRAATYRLDLEVFNPLTDATESGIPDWWKTRYGVTDPNADPTGDGWSNFQKFLIGANPNQDYRIPALQTSELVAYADGTTGMRLQTLDSDSGATNVFYAVKTLPQSGVFYLRNSSANATTAQTPLAVGASFTQEDINKGRLLFVHQGTGGPSVTDSFQVSLHDENANHPVSNSVVTLNVYRPSYPDATLQTAAAFAAAPATTTNIAGLSYEEQQMVLNYFLSRNQGYVIWDASRASTPQTIAVPSSDLSQAQYAEYVSAHGHDRQYVFVAGSGNDQLYGGMENDILISGRGSDTLRGGGGGDLFIIPGPSAGNVTIQDFNASENDALDISRVLLGSATSLANYVQVTNSGNDSRLLINFSGSGANFTNLVVTLVGTHFSQEDLQAMVDNGNLITGQKATMPRISIVASIQAASQNGQVPGEFTLTRNSGIATSLTVNLQITGSAINGNDYQYLAPQATFAAGQKTVTVQINPYLNSSLVPQIVQAAIVAGTGYEVGTSASAQVSIAPLSPQISIQAIETVASKQDQSTGLFLVTRGGVINSSVLVRLVVGGTAPSSHYSAISSYINFLPQQTTALITISPNPAAVISNRVEFVQISIKPDSSYVVMSPSMDRVAIVDRRLTFALWQQDNFPGVTVNPAAFANSDPGGTGILALYRYAYGLNAQNPQDSLGIPGYRILDNHLSVSFKRPAAVSDLNYVVEVSDDLVHWRSSAKDVEQIIPQNGSNDLETVWFRSLSSASETPKSFMRVRVVRQP